MEEEWTEAEQAQRDKQDAVLKQVGEDMLRTHGDEPGPKKEGIIRLTSYENANGIHCGHVGTRKIEKARN